MTLSVKPTDLRTRHTSGAVADGEAWFYEESNGLLVVVQHKREDGSWSTSMHDIPWAKVRQSLARKNHQSVSKASSS